MNTKIRDRETLEVKKSDEIFRGKYGKSLDKVYPWPGHYQAVHIELFCKPCKAIYADYCFSM